ncbi:hypothetical protein [Mucilaginibacter sp. JRF]|uniref:hypothetical protein n=1 Tax=Mucilaginibacter sp. JRF TaxID=2780088 RepID=UPI001D163CB5|nr:hypothetical protein [Mucilaginibacter sp. JRF]
MAFCNFLLIEPKTDRSKVVMENIDKVFKGVDKKNINIIYDKTNGGLLKTLITEMAITRAASAVDSLQQKGVADSAVIFTYQLETIFKAAGEQSAEIKAPKGFYWNYYADFFYALTQSGNLPAFARYISLSSNHQTSVEWFKNNDDKITKLSQWLATTKRNF